MDIGIQEILLLSVLALLVLGPERLPETVRTIAIWVARIRRNGQKIWRSIEQEIDADGIRQRIHNEDILSELGESKKALDDIEHELKRDVLGDSKDSGVSHLSDETSPSAKDLLEKEKFAGELPSDFEKLISDQEPTSRDS